MGRILSGKHLYIFSKKAFVLKKISKGKLHAKVTPGVFVGYTKNAQGFLIYLPEKYCYQTAKS